MRRADLAKTPLFLSCRCCCCSMEAPHPSSAGEDDDGTMNEPLDSVQMPSTLYGSQLDKMEVESCIFNFRVGKALPMKKSFRGTECSAKTVPGEEMVHCARDRKKWR